MATAYREGRPRTSLAWDHFEIKDREKGVATCNICHDAFSYRTSVSNLMKHLKNRHGYSVVKGEEEQDNGQAENGRSLTQQKIKTELWEYYDVKDEENKLATCNMCLDQFSFAKSLEELFGHLQSKHSVDFGKEAKSDEDGGPADDDEEFSLQSISEHKVRLKSSVAWEYFEVKDDEKKVASCLTCGALCSFKSSVSNLMKHARRKHGVQIEMQDDENEGADATAEVDDSKISSDQRRAQRSIVWLYFKCINSKLARCRLCNKTLSHSSTTTNLRKHLARKHPNVKIPAKEDGQQRILLSSGGQLYELDTKTKLETDDADEDMENNQDKTCVTVCLSKKQKRITQSECTYLQVLTLRDGVKTLKCPFKHRNVLNNFDKYENVSLTTINADLSALFTEEDGEESFRCVLCHAVITGDHTDLRTHLSDRHSEKPPEMEEEEEDENDVYTEVVYLEKPSPVKESRLKHKKRKIIDNFVEIDTYNDDYLETEYLTDSGVNLNLTERKPQPSKANSKVEHSKFTEKPAVPKSDLNDELEKFGSYIASLLRSFPKKVCTKLQMNIVNQIMEEKLKLDDDDDAGNSSGNVTVSKTLVREFTKSVSELE